MNANTKAILEMLNRLESPQDVYTILVKLEQICEDGESVCSEAWQDKRAGEPWKVMAKGIGALIAKMNRDDRLSLVVNQEEVR